MTTPLLGLEFRDRVWDNVRVRDNVRDRVNDRVNDRVTLVLG